MLQHFSQCLQIARLSPIHYKLNDLEFKLSVKIHFFQNLLGLINFLLLHLSYIDHVVFIVGGDSHNIAFNRQLL